MHSTDGVLRSLPELITDMFKELKPDFTLMLTDAFASHILQVLMAILSGVPTSSFDDLRSKRSTKYRSKDRQKAMIGNATGNNAEEDHFLVPPAFIELLYQLYNTLAEALQASELHAMVPNAVAAPTLSLLLRLEGGLSDKKQRSMAWRKDSLTLRVLEYTGDESGDRSDFMEASLRDAVATHVLESALSSASESALVWFWNVYICGRVAKLGSHPCANFVVASMLRLLPAEGETKSPFFQALQELTQAGDQLVKHQVLGVLQAAVERAIVLENFAGEAMQAITAAFRFPQDADAETRQKFVPVVLSMHTLKAYSNIQKEKSDKPSGKRKHKDRGQPEFAIQGSILLQRISLLPPPYQAWLYERYVTGIHLKSLATESLVTWCTSATAVHVVLAALGSKDASFAQRRALITKLMPHLVDLCDDAWGSRVADALWLTADGFTKAS